MCFASVLLYFCTPCIAYMQLLEWLSLMKEVVMCINKNLKLKVQSRSTILQAKLEFSKGEGRSGRGPLLPKTNVTF